MPDALGPRDLVSRPENMDETVLSSYLENASKQSQIRLFQTVSFCPDHAV